MGGIGNTAALLNPSAVPTPGVGNQRPQSLITYAEGNVPPPSALYVGLNDQIQVLVQAGFSGSTNLELDLRYLLPDGTIQIQSEVVPCLSNFTITNLLFHMAEGFLLSVALRCNDTTFKRGSLFAVINLVRQINPNTTINLTLTKGGVTFFAPVCWPAIPPDFPQNKPGVIRQVVIGAPAAGVDFSTTVPNLARWRVIALRASLTTAVAVANREVILALGTAGSPVYNAIAVPLQAASLTYGYSWGAGVTTLLVIAGATTPNINTSIPVDLWLPNGSTVASVTQNLQAADQWSSVQLLVEECIDT